MLLSWNLFFYCDVYLSEMQRCSKTYYVCSTNCNRDCILWLIWGSWLEFLYFFNGLWSHRHSGKSLISSRSLSLSVYMSLQVSLSLFVSLSLNIKIFYVYIIRPIGTCIWLFYKLSTKYHLTKKQFWNSVQPEVGIRSCTTQLDMTSHYRIIA